MANERNLTVEWEPERYEMREPVPYFFAVDRREFLGIVGAGLLIAVASPAAAQRGGGAAAPEARVHLAEDGSVTVLTGKIEEGQGARTELTMVAAEELRLPVDRVRLVMADTDVVPNDGITAGSRTTPTTVPSVRQAAAAGRQLLIETAARRWRSDAARLEVKDGSVRDGARSLSYGDLAREAH